MAVVRKYRLSKLPRWLAGIYLVWSMFVYFGTLGQEGHAWWPLFPYYVIWPVSFAYERVNSMWLDRMPKSAPEWAWWVEDGVSGGFYIVIGTIWIWFLGRLFSRMITHFFPLDDGKNVGVTKHTEDVGN